MAYGPDPGARPAYSVEIHMTLVKTSKIAGSAAKTRRSAEAARSVALAQPLVSRNRRPGKGQGFRKGGGGHGGIGQRFGTGVGRSRGTSAVRGADLCGCGRGSRSVAGAVDGDQAGRFQPHHRSRRGRQFTAQDRVRSGSTRRDSRPDRRINPIHRAKLRTAGRLRSKERRQNGAYQDGRHRTLSNPADG